MSIAYVYAIECPTSGDIKYIGSTYTPKERFKTHIDTAKRSKDNKPLYEWISTLLQQGRKPIFNILFTCDLRERTSKEVQTIRMYMPLGTLLNIRLNA